MKENGTEFKSIREKATIALSNYNILKAHIADISDTDSAKHHSKVLLVQLERRHKIITDWWGP